MAVAGISPVAKKEKKNKLATAFNILESGIGLANMASGFKSKTPKGVGMGGSKPQIDFGVDTDIISKYIKRGR